MPYLEYIFGAALIILTIVLTAVGVQMYLLLVELRQTTQRVNTVIDEAEVRMNSVITPLQQIGASMTTVRASFKVFDAFAAWLNKAGGSSEKNGANE